jgi:hypothetical protein
MSAHENDGSIAIEFEGAEGRILRFDSATFVPGFYEDRIAPKDVVVAASFSGVLPARMIARSTPRGVIGLDCAIGKDGAGIAGLWFYEALGIPAAAASTRSAEMGNGRDLWEEGVLSRVNEIAEAMGLAPGMSVRVAADMLLRNPRKAADRERREVMATHPSGRSIICTDSIAFARPEDKGRNVLCTASHTGRSVVGYITDASPWGFICSDGGIGKRRSGITALHPVNEAGIPGASVDAQTARMGDGHSTYLDGIISAANDLALAKGVRIDQTAIDAAKLLLE